MPEKLKSPESVATNRADSFMDANKARTRRWWGRGWAGFATAVLTFAAALVTFPYVPPLGIGLAFVSFGAAAAGIVSAGIGTGSGIANTVRA